jgi:queuine tRNA-ribosyltransferase
MFQIISKSGKARLGILKTKHGEIETPFYMPCATMATGKCIGSQEYKDLGVKAIIANSFLLSLKPGVQVISKAGGLHKFMSYQGIIFTDCGGFQCSRDMFIEATKKGLHFRSPFDNSKQIITPKKIIEIQQHLGSDIAVSLDHMAPYGASLEETKKAMKTTHEWAKLSLDAHIDKEQLLFGICQGGFNKDLRKESARFISSLEFDGIAVGGLAIGEPREKMLEMMESSLSEIPENKIRYCMGIGHPLDIIEAVSRGIDCFDSVFPTQNARHGNLFTFKGKIDIAHLKHKFDNSPIDKECSCSTCRNYTKSYIHHLYKIKEPSYRRMASIHNLEFMQRFCKDIRKALSNNNLEQYREKIRQAFK